MKMTQSKKGWPRVRPAHHPDLLLHSRYFTHCTKSNYRLLYMTSLLHDAELVEGRPVVWPRRLVDLIDAPLRLVYRVDPRLGLLSIRGQFMLRKGETKRTKTKQLCLV
jgi:hypothetical protein